MARKVAAPWAMAVVGSWPNSAPSIVLPGFLMADNRSAISEHSGKLKRKAQLHSCAYLVCSARAALT